ncbi:MAG TPA: DNA repair protein RadC [Alphaproteobacteria bacterium]|nr:DNA repair protein RadC [Alphaproteobacteria bacterium]HOO51428.1 DNA repair protein RadC [Alphaproteobacteria bacterium]
MEQKLEKTLKSDNEPPPHYAGHRDRLRERFLKGGVEALADYEIVELILFMAIPRRDVKPLAKELLQKFGSFNAIFHASENDLSAHGLTDTSITALKIIKAASFKFMKQDLLNKQVLNSWAKLMDYLQATMAHEKKENFRLLFLNKKNELIADEIQQSGTVDHTPAYPREIVKRALELSATAVILIHNHPSGDATPSKADIDMTQQIIAAAKPLGIVIHDHLIVSRNGTTSMRSKGLL